MYTGSQVTWERGYLVMVLRWEKLMSQLVSDHLHAYTNIYVYSSRTTTALDISESIKDCVH